MSRGAYLLRSVARLAGANLIARIAGIGALVYYARALSPAELATLPVFLLLANFVTVPSSLGLFATLIREVPGLLLDDPKQARALIRSVLLTVGAGVLVCGLACYMLATPIAIVFLKDVHSSRIVRFMALGTVVRGFDDIVVYVLRATSEFKSLASKKLISELTQPLFSILLIPSIGAAGLVLGSTIGLLLGLAWGVLKARKYLLGRSGTVRLAPLIKRSRSFYAEGAVFFLIQQGDQAVVGAFLPSMVLAGYYVARRVLDALGILLYTADEIMGPSLARAMRGGVAQFRQVLRDLAFSMAAVILPTGALAAALTGGYLALLGASYLNLFQATAILTLSIIPQAAFAFISLVALVAGRPSDRPRITAFFAVVLLTLTAVTAHWGVTAVAVGRAIAATLSTVIAFVFARRLLPPLPWREISHVFGPTLVLVAPIALIQSIGQRYALLPAGVAAGLMLFVISFRFMLPPSERERAWHLLRGAAQASPEPAGAPEYE